MGDTDAFGREKGEDTLAGLGGTGGSSWKPPTTRTAAPAKPQRPGIGTAPARPASGPPAPRWPATGGNPVRTARRAVAVLVFVGATAAVLVPVVITGRTAVSTFRSVTNAITAPASPSSAAPAGRRPAGSLLRPAAFRRAVAALRRGRYGRLRLLRVASDRIDAQMVTPDGRLRSVQLPAGGRPTVLSTTGPGFPAGATLALARLDPRAPARLAAGARRRAHSGLDYAAIIGGTAGVKVGWTVVTKSGAQFVADAHGRITRRIN